MASKAAIATAWIRVLPSMEGLQQALMKASRGTVLSPKVMPQMTSSIFGGLGSKAGGLFAGLFNTTSKKTINAGMGGLLGELKGNFSRGGSQAGGAFGSGFGSYLGANGISSYLKLPLAIAGVGAVGSSVGKVAGNVLSLGNAWGRVQGMVRNAIGQQGDLQGALKMTTSAANEIGVPMKELATESARLVKLAPNTIPDYGTAVRFTSLLSKNMITTGASTEEVNSVMRQVTQSLGKGIVNGDELNSIMENAPEIAQILADHLHVSVGELKNMGKQGKITGNDLRDSILGAQQRINDEFMKMPMTADRAWNAVANDFQLQMEDAYIKSSTAFGDSIKKLSTSGLITSFATYLSKNMQGAFDDVSKMFSHLIDLIAPFKTVFDDAAKDTSPFIQALDSITQRFQQMNLQQLVDGLKIVATLGSIAFSGILGGTNQMLSRIPLVRNALVGLKKSVGTVGAALGGMAGAGVNAFGKLISKAGEATGKLSKLFNGFGNNAKMANNFKQLVNDMDSEQMPKKFKQAIADMEDGTKPFDKSVKHMENVINHLSTTALGNLPKGFDEAMNAAQESVEKTSDDMQSKIGGTFKNIVNLVRHNINEIPESYKTAYADVSTIIDASAATAISSQSKFTGNVARATDNARSAIVKSFSSLTGIKIPDFLTPAVGAMIGGVTNEVRRLTTIVTTPLKAVGSVAGKIGSKVGQVFGEGLSNGSAHSIPQLVRLVVANSQPLVGDFKELAAKVSSAFHPSFDGALSAIRKFGDEYSSVLQSTIGLPKGLSNGMANVITKPLTGAISTVRSGMNVITQTVSGTVKHFGGLGTIASKTFGTIASGALKISGGALKGIGKTLSGISKGFSAIGRAASSLGATAAVTSALGTAFTQLYHTDPSQMGDAIQGMANKMGMAMTNISVQVPAMATAFAQMMPQVISSFTGALPTLISSVTGALNTVITAITNNMPAIMDAVTGGINAIVSAIPQVLPTLVNGVLSLVTSIAYALPGMLSVLGNALVTTIGSLAQILPVALPQFMTAIQVMMTQIGAQLPTFATQFAASLTSLVQGIAATLPGMISSFIMGVSQLVVGIINMLPTLLPTLIQGVVSLVNGLVQGLPQMITVLAAMLPQIINGFVATFSAVVPALVNGAISLVNAIVTNLPTIIQSLVAALPEVLNALVTGLTSNAVTLVNGAIQLVIGLVAALPQIIEALIDAMPMVLSMIGNAIITNGPEIISAFGQAIVSLAAALPQLFGIVIGAIPGILVNIASAFAGLGGRILGFISDIPDKIRGLFNGAGNWLQEAGRSIMNGLVKGLKDAWSGVTDFVGGIAGWIKDHKGPISYDRVLLIPAGLAIMRGFHKALEQGYKQVQSFVNSIAPSLQSSVADSVDPLYRKPSPFDNGVLRSVEPYNGSVGKPQVVNINVPTRIIREDDDLYTATPRIARALQTEFQGANII